MPTANKPVAISVCVIGSGVVTKSVVATSAAAGANSTWAVSGATIVGDATKLSTTGVGVEPPLEEFRNETSAVAASPV